jgi:capsular polysaccharide transport system ATP-binding protein
MIRFVNAGKAFRARRNREQLVWPIRNFSATIERGESTAILAREGSGKTTLIGLVAGSENLTEGEIIRTGHISWPASFRGMINPRMTARQNLRFLCDTYGHDFRAAHDFVQDFAELGRYMDLVVKQCSTDQRHRLALAVLFAMNFEFILVDDTFEAGDAPFRRRVQDFIEDNAERITFLMATSSGRLAERYCKRVGILADGGVIFYDSMAEGMAVFRRMKTESDY